MEELAKYVSYLPYLLGGIVWGLLATPIAGIIAKKYEFVDLPPSMREGKDQTKDRRIHKVPMPRLGGVVISLPVLLMPLILGPSPWVIGLALSVLMLNILAVLDDKFEISASLQFVLLFVIVLVAVLSGICIKQVQNPFDGLFNFEVIKVTVNLFGQQWTWYLVAIIITVFWILMVGNAINWIDSIGGIAASIVALILLVIALVAIREWNHSVAVISTVLLGSTLAFLPFNVLPEKIFLGGGAMTVGFMVGVLSVLGQAKISTWLLVLGLPIIDFGLVIIGRIKRARIKSLGDFMKAISSGDKTHLAHKLEDAGLERRQVFWAEFGITLILALLALAVSGLYLAFVIIAVCGIILLVIGVLYRKKSSSEKDDKPDHASPEEKFAY